MAATGTTGPGVQGRRLAAWAGWIVLLALLFLQPLMGLMRYAVQTDLHSHVPLVPLIAGYLFSTRWASLPAPGRPSPLGAAAPGALGFAALAAAIAWRAGLSPNDYYALMALAFLGLVAAGGFLILGAPWMAAAAFPVAFLVFMVPLPDAAVLRLEQASAAASAEAAALFFTVAGTPLVRRGTVFELPGIVIQVAQECSGIRSSWVLFVTSVLASQLFLASPLRRAVLVAFVIPLGILRNGFRVFVIGMLCVRVGPHMIDSVIHRRGGPVFFLLSLVPLFLLLWWLRRREPRAQTLFQTP
jgi:exosortase C (VPDSG-CTERM-specific)